jgi:hypothetical protein
MIKIITKVGNSQGIIFDSALLQLTRLKVGDEVNVEVHREDPSPSRLPRRRSSAKPWPLKPPGGSSRKNNALFKVTKQLRKLVK